MFFKYSIITAAIFIVPMSAQAQCFNRDICADKSILQIRSQLSVTVPVPNAASASEEVKAMEDARRELYALSNRECDSLRATFGGDCNLSNINMNSQTQDRGSQGRSASVSISSTYEIKRPVK